MSNVDKAMPIPYIFDAYSLHEAVPPGFNAVKVTLEAGLKSELDWKIGLETARSYAEQGLKLFWNLRLGLFDDLALPLANEMQFRSLGLALKHFQDQVWKSFESESIGVCLYRGSLEFSRGIDSCGEYLSLLAQHLPDVVDVYLCLDATSVSDPLLQAKLLNKERFEHFHLIVRGSKFPLNELSWETKGQGRGLLSRTAFPIYPIETTKWALCFPSAALHCNTYDADLRKAIQILDAKQVPYRIIPESYLTQQWEGLDTLIVLNEGLSPQGVRKLQGFLAAGGEAIEVKDFIG